MREIKFRTPTKCQNGHFRWFYYSVSFGKCSVKFGDKHPDCTCPTWDFKEGFQECGPDQQFLGLKDKAGKEIYEGDILHIWSYYTNGNRTYDRGNWEVFWRNDRWHLRRGEEGYDNGDYYQGDECPWPEVDNWKPSENGPRIEIIGNIHENPELIP